MKKLLKQLGAAAVMTASALTSVVHAEDPLKVGFVYVSPTGEAGWTFTHNEGRKYVEEKFGDKVETRFVESVKEGADAERAIMQMAKSGYDLIFTTSFGYMNPTIKVAKKFPNIAFEHATGYKRSENVGTYFDRIYEARYLTGVVAGHMTKSNVIGYVAAFPIPEVIRGINAFTQGLRSVKPEATVKVVWVNSWYDPGKEREAGDSLIQQGADVLTQHTDSPGVVQAAEAAGKYAIGYHSDMSAYGAKAHLTAAVHNWNEFYAKRVQQVIDGTWKSEDVWEGINSGMTTMAPMSDAVPAEVQKQVAALKADIASGKVHPFAGPVKNQAGEIVVKAGETMEVGAMLGMNFYVEGVQGQLPK